MTPQMSVLGRDGRDLDMGYHNHPSNHCNHESPLFLLTNTTRTNNQNSEQQSTTTTNQISSKWWGTWKFPSSTSKHFLDGRQHVKHGIHHPSTASTTVNDLHQHRHHHRDVDGSHEDDNEDDSASYISMGEKDGNDLAVDESVSKISQSYKSSNQSVLQKKMQYRSLALFHPPSAAAAPPSLGDAPILRTNSNRNQNNEISNNYAGHHDVLFTPVPTTSSNATVASREEYLVKPPGKEEAVRNDCSFFYQDLDESYPATTTTTANHNPATSMTAGAMAYNPLVPVAPRHRATYRARFQQLNQELQHYHISDNICDDDNELWFQEEQDDIHDNHDDNDAMDAATIINHTYTTRATISNCVSNISHSSLCWAQDGRILMTLPKDKVRLLMDEDLEPGILSVEHCSNNASNHHRHPNNNNDKNQEDHRNRREEKEHYNHHDNGDDDAPYSQSRHQQQLMYVLTVDENLYRRVIGEISDATSSRFGLHQFCMDEGRVDISVAIMCLLLVMVILLINTIICPVE